MKWKKLVHKQNARHYAWPSGWDTAEQIAEQLECSPERVREHLAPSIRAGEVEMKQFTIWDGETERKVVRTGFRISCRKEAMDGQESGVESSRVSPHRADRWPFSEGARIMRPDNPKRIGLVKNGRIHWNDGKVSIPAGASQASKLRLTK